MPKTLCLNMIVKNESKIIQRCLASVKPLIDYWIIVDTGSTDGTQDAIREFMKDIPGELHERPWVDFAHNRNEALDFAKGKCDYLLFIDADEVLQYSSSFVMPQLDKDYYFSNYYKGALLSSRILLVNNHLNWKWQGIIHESLICEEAQTSDLIKEVINIASAMDGARSLDKDKCFKDAQILEKALEKDPNNSRYVYHLALTYGAANQYELALKNYERRLEIGGNHQREIFVSLYQVALLKDLLEMDSNEVIKDFLKAAEYRKGQIEPILALVNHFMKEKQFFLGYLLAKYALTITQPPPSFGCFIETWMYEYGALMLFAECSFQIGKMNESYHAFKQLLTVKNLPEDIRILAEQNVADLGKELLGQNNIKI